MFMSIQDIKAKEEKTKLEATCTVVYLNELHHLLNNKKFINWYTSNESRFEWCTNELSEKLRYDFMYQLNQMLDRDERELSLSDKFKVFADNCLELAERIEQRRDLAIPKKDKKFTFTRGADPTKLVTDFLSRKELTNINRELETHDSFYTWNSISSLVMFARARDTLLYPIANAQFETLLAGLTTEYMVKGYPKDILTHDAIAFRNNLDVKAISRRRDYCSTYIMVGKADIIAYENGELIYFCKQAANAACTPLII